MKNIVLIIFILLSLTGCDREENLMYEPSGVLSLKKIYKFGVHPYLNSQKMYKSYRPILNYLEAHLQDVEFILETSSNYNSYDIKLYRGDFDFSLPNPYQTYNSLQYNYRVIAKMKPDTVFRGIFIARKDSHIRRVEQLKNNKISFPAKTALAAAMVPLYYLHEHGLDIKKDIEKLYVGSQYSSILNVYTSDTLVGATWPPPWESFSKEHPEKAAKLEVIWQTEPLINNGFVVKNSVDTKLAEQVAKLLVELSENSEGKKLLEDAGFAGFEYADDAKYSIIKTFLDKYNRVKP